MKKNKGFTLAELLGVIVILGLLLLLVFPTIIGQMKKGEAKISEATEKIIFNAASNYIDGNLNKYPVSTNVTYCFTLEELVNAKEVVEGLLIDSKGNKLDFSKKVEVKITDGSKSFQMNDSCSA
jgi:prepilin-type N-terminal cleavage/methylation domain-containing protein